MTVAARLVRCGAVTGQVTDAGGKPVAGARVMAMLKPTAKAADVPLQPDFATGRIANVDARGQYRLYNLRPGEYAVVVSCGASTIAVGSTGGSVTPSNLGSGFLFFPENANPRFFQIAGGVEIDSINFTIREAPMFSVSGQVQSPDPKARFWIALSSPSQPALASAVTQASQDGTFRFEGISPRRLQSSCCASQWRARFPRSHSRFRSPIRPRARHRRCGKCRRHRDRAGEWALGQVQPSVCRGLSREGAACPEDWGAQLERRMTLTTAKDETVSNLAPSRYSVTAAVADSECVSAPNAVIDLTGSADTRPILVEVTQAAAAGKE